MEKVVKFEGIDFKKMMNGEIFHLSDDITVQRKGNEYTVTYGKKCGKVTISGIYRLLTEWWEEEDKVWVYYSGGDGSSYIVCNSEQEMNEYKFDTINDWIEGELNSDIFDTSFEDEEDGIKCFRTSVSLLNMDKEITISYNVDEDTIYMTDGYYNGESFTLLDSFDRFIFSNEFYDTLEKLLKQTLTDTMCDLL